MSPYYSARFDAALTLAAQLHRTQLRKGSDVPYITHVVHVAILLIRAGYGEDVAIAGLLHDAVEDQRYPLERIAVQFGDGVAALVAEMSEERYAGESVRPWEERKQEKLDSLRTAPPEALAVKAADLLHNICTTTADLRAHGPALWERFTRGREGLLWYYRSVAEVLRARLAGQPLVVEVEEALGELERLAAQAA